ncbi:PA0069 family radical SAM protein [Frigidibacter sp. ROC022]|uniref:PA0069 family radical SAM protein n=1 Tax=Frigidibacter sp. ROC022 TaxID=2971796 RepID=UPI00215B577E|nr:PA0069 family radical SAM protein [Frigidibacter sp. ROC022]MCR8726442.1 PA0069 family radical SAM protein [Frigidibacter sp. ROC022]
MSATIPPAADPEEETRVLPASRRRGRAAATNDPGRFEGQSRAMTDDGWPRDDGDLPPIRTEVRLERPRSVISRNSSPDIPFDRSINPYRGCEHGCIYCFARPGHAYLNLSPGLDFETRLIARPGAGAVLERELRAKSYRPAVMAIGTYTDPYQPVETRYRVMRELIEVLSAFNHPLGIVTKGSGIERDLDLLAPMAAKGLLHVGISVTTLDPKLARTMEPRVPAPARRLRTIRRLAEAGIPVRVMVAPVIPGLTDPELEAILAAGAEAGARSASWIMLRLPREVSPLFRDWLAEHYPDRFNRVMSKLREMHGGQDYSADWGKRMRGEGTYAELVGQRFRLAARRLGLDRPLPPLRCDLFAPPARAGDQLSLF